MPEDQLPFEPSESTSEPSDSVPVDNHDEKPDQIGSGIFVLLVICIAALVGAVVYVAGQASSASKDAAEAEARADQILNDSDVDLGEFVNPNSIPLTDDTLLGDTTTVPTAPGTTVTPPSTDAVDDSRLITGAGNHPEIDLSDVLIAVVFVNRAPGDDYGKVGLITFDNERIITELRCSRIDLNPTRGLCLAPPSQFLLSGHGLVLGPDLVPESRFDVNDPSRAVVSPDGALVAWTGFTSGHSYAEVGEFSTITQLIAVERGLAVDLEANFTTEVDGQNTDEPERNYWGVTFASNDQFYATMGIGADMWIVEGSVSDAKIENKWANASCPEVSPDGSTIVAKEMRGDRFQLISIDVATGDRRDLGETRSVDDQVEWLDEDTIVYAIANDEEGTGAQPAFDIYILDIAPGSTPELLIPLADSPAVL